MGSQTHILDLCYHQCKNKHYGNQGIVRDDCVLAYIDALDTTRRVAITADHPAARVAVIYYNHLTEAEIELAEELTFST